MTTPHVSLSRSPHLLPGGVGSFVFSLCLTPVHLSALFGSRGEREFPASFWTQTLRPERTIMVFYSDLLLIASY